MKKRVIFILLIIIGIFIFGMRFFIFNDNSNNSESDISRLRNISKDIFDLYDKGYLGVGDYIDFDNEYNKDKLPRVYDDIKVINKRNQICGLKLIDKDVIFFTYGAYYQSVSGVAVTRNNIELKDTYKGTGYDEGTLRYTKTERNIFLYSVGL
jgi:hypothetical protein